MTAIPVKSVNPAEAPEPHEGFTARTVARVWAIMWAAGYDLPPASKFVDPGARDDMNLATVTAGPREGRNVAVCERAGAWAVCELGTGDEDPIGGYVAVRLCHLRFWRSVKGIDLHPDGTKTLYHTDPPHVPPEFDEEGNLKCRTPKMLAAGPTGVGGGNPETHPCA